MTSANCSCGGSTGRAYSTCGCCSGVESRTPQSVENPPGQPALAYRAGVHGEWLESMKAALPLPLQTRAPEDFSLALLDASAVVADILSFYQERIANEGFLRTATERRSIVELARLIGYTPKPAVSASTYLAYTIDPNTREEVTIPAGAKAQTVPGPGESLQTFETREELRARAQWNVLRPRLTAPPSELRILRSRALYVKGISTQLKAGDPLLLVGALGRPVLLRVLAVEPDSTQQITKLGVGLWTTAKSDELDLLREQVDSLVRSAPSGKTADAMRTKLEPLAAALHTQSRDEVRTLVREDTQPALDLALSRVQGLPATRLRPWLDEVRVLVDTLLAVDPLDELEAVTKAVVSAKPVSESFAPVVTKLIQPGSKPLPNALQLPRAIERSFSPAGDSGLRILGAVAPEARGVAAAALAAHEGAAPPTRLEVFAFRLKTGLFGRTFPPPPPVPPVIGLRAANSPGIDEWQITVGRGADATEHPNRLELDGSHEGIVPGSWVVADFTSIPRGGSGPVLSLPERPLLIEKVASVAAKVARAKYGAPGDSTRIELPVTVEWIADGTDEEGEGDEEDESSDSASLDTRNFQIVRQTNVYAQSERLELAEIPLDAPDEDFGSDLEASEYLELDALYAELEPGRFLIVEGQRSDIDGVAGIVAAEAVMITEVVHDVRDAFSVRPFSKASERRVGKGVARLPGDRNHTFVGIDKPLSYRYVRNTVSIYANVVKATHGETQTEILGSGDASKAGQTFALKQAPLTYLAAPTPVGSESTLSVFVQGVRWREAPDFIDQPATANVLTLRVGDDSSTRVTTGDGREGARLPTGTGNIMAIYRNGGGRPGNARAGQISLLGTRPLGVREVRNPLRASGGADRESRDQARKLAPLAVKALDRLVSVADYADFARTYAGIAKAHALELSDGTRSVVHVTIAGVDDVPIDPASDLFLNLRRALVVNGDANQPLVLALREQLLLVLSARIRIEPDRRWEDVVISVRARLLEAFSFERRELVQSATSSEVLSVIQGVPGVRYVDLDLFGGIPTQVPDEDAAGAPILRPLTPFEIAKAIAELENAEVVRAEAARWEREQLLPAQIAVLSPELPDTLVLNQIA